MCENPFFELVGAKGYSDSYRSTRLENEFDQFKNKHDRKYKNEVEEAQRKTHFRHNYRLGMSCLGQACQQAGLARSHRPVFDRLQYAKTEGEVLVVHFIT